MDVAVSEMNTSLEYYTFIAVLRAPPSCNVREPGTPIFSPLFPPIYPISFHFPRPPVFLAFLGRISTERVTVVLMPIEV